MSKIGRNDSCPCGSGKKYKNCCLRKVNLDKAELIKTAVKDDGYSDDIGEVLSSLYSYMRRKQWIGACHASCAALYVALSELGYKPELCIGEVLGNGLYFDHSWITLDGKIIDLAVNMTLLNGTPASEVIIFDRDILERNKFELDYGVPGRGIEGQALMVMQWPFNEFMDNFPDEVDGLWGVVREILHKNVDIQELREKYKDTKRILIRHDGFHKKFIG